MKNMKDDKNKKATNAKKAPEVHAGSMRMQRGRMTSGGFMPRGRKPNMA